MNKRIYSQLDVDLYTDACGTASKFRGAGMWQASESMYQIADSLRPCHYEGPDN